MASKKRKVEHADSDTLPNKRVTRSAGKAPAIKESKPSKPPAKNAKPPIAAKKSKKDSTVPSTAKSKSKSAPLKDTKIDISTDSGPPENVETITIPATHTKKPFQCQIYAGPKESSDPATLIFTHGAGGLVTTPAVVNFCTGFSTTMAALAFQGTMHLGSRAKGFHACIEYLREQHQSQKKGKQPSGLVLGGRSMGARAAVLAATEILEGDAEEKDAVESIQLVLVSYPLKGQKDDVRDQILLDLPESVRVLFVIGDNDNMCPLNMLDEVRLKMKAKNEIIIINGADHGMHVKPASGEKELGEKAGRLAAEWVAGRLQIG